CAVLSLRAALSVLPAGAHAGAFISGVGAKFGMGNSKDAAGVGTIGVHVELGGFGSRWSVLPGVFYWNGEGNGEGPANGVSGNLDVLYSFLGPALTSPYVGAGAGAFHTNLADGGSRDDFGGSFFRGLLLPRPAPA